MHSRVEKDLRYLSKFTAILLFVFTVFSTVIYSSTWKMPLVYDSAKSILFQNTFRNGAITTLISSGRPVTMLSLYLNYLVGGETANYRLTNSIILSLSSVAVFMFIYLALSAPPSSAKSSTKRLVATIMALLFLLHPLQVNATTYVIQRGVLLSSLFYISGLNTYMLARLKIISSKGYFLSFLCFMLALLSKENSAMFPVTLFFMEMLLFQKIGPSITGEEYRKRNEENREAIRCLKKYILLGLIAIILCFFVRPTAIGYVINEYRQGGISLASVLLSQCRIAFFYISIILFPEPSRLTLLHVPEYSVSILQPLSTLFSIIGLFIISVFAIRVRNTRPLLSFGIVFFFLNILIESVLLPRHLIFEHRAILPMAGILLVLSVFIYPIIDKYELKGYHTHANIIIPTILILIFFCSSTIERNKVWQSRVDFWGDIVDKLPLYAENIDKKNYLFAHYNFGASLGDSGRIKKSIVQFKKVLEIDPTYAGAYYNIGIAFGRLGERQRSIKSFRKAIELEPELAAAHYHIGLALKKSGQMPQAIKHMKTALQLNPGYARLIKHQ